MNKKSIFGNKSQPASDCFDRAGTPKGVLVVPMDLAKEEHVAAVCPGTGQYLSKPFRVFNGPDGVDYLLKRIDGLRRQRASGPKTSSHAGIVPRQKQTGGFAKPPIVGSLPRDANRILKDYLLQAAFHAGFTGDNRFTEHYRTVEARGGRSRLGTAKLLLRIGRAMARTQTVFLPRWGLRPDGDRQPRSRLIDYYTETILSLQRKWRRFDLNGIPPERHNLEKCKETLHELIARTQ
ncbi:MAG: hypothetical protein GXP31_14330 [Kiritimatiellaeota bacterium]|nr:hypothetical protein [Kiritimatiellota bacterium]